MNTQLALILGLMLMTATASASEMLPRLGEVNGCHLLMTQKECGEYTATLAGLAPGEARDAYVLAHNQLMREREKACSCNSLMVESESELRSLASRRYQPGRQALLRF